METILLLRLLSNAFIITSVSAVCYFPIEYQGIFSTQSTLAGGPSHKYSLITILPDAIPVWGVCHEMTGPDVILHDATGGQECFRCFHVNLHSPNIIQVFTEGLDKCYNNEGAARATCPTKSDIKNRIAREIMLYKSRSFSRDGLIDRVFCPFSGQFHFTYDVDDGTENIVECAESKSTLSNCPKGSELELKFSECRFRDSSMSLRCLGDWTGIDGYKYFALWDTGVASESQPQYRCGMYHRDKDTGRVFVAFSEDATCTNRLQSPWDGYETMILTPAKLPSPPAPVHIHSCLFPHWANGEWKDMKIRGRELWWRHEERDKIYQTLCLSQKRPNGEKFALYSLNQCGDQEFTCIWMKKRDINVFEFKMATVQYNYFNSNRICDDDVFIGQEWHTQGRLTKSEETNCPVLGEYSGVIPDAPELCAHLASDCDQPQLMHYTVSSCSNKTQVFEKREYQCLGQWKEGSIMYTFTYRPDVMTYECFAGVVVNQKEAFIIEAGVSCQRGLQPLIKGMKLIKQASCDDVKKKKPTMQLDIRPLTPTKPSLLPAWWPSTSRKPWLKKSTTTTQKPQWKNQKPRDAPHSSGTSSILNTSLSSSLLLLLSFYQYLISR